VPGKGKLIPLYPSGGSIKLKEKDSRKGNEGFEGYVIFLGLQTELPHFLNAKSKPLTEGVEGGFRGRFTGGWEEERWPKLCDTSSMYEGN